MQNQWIFITVKIFLLFAIFSPGNYKAQGNNGAKAFTFEIKTKTNLPATAIAYQ